jgi:hypothetical protein
MTGMKITVDAAMRARDVSRPHAEQDELAEGREPGPPAGNQRTAPGNGSNGSRGNGGSLAAGTGATDMAGSGENGAGGQVFGKRRRKRH